jgi:Cys-tRNA(Pro)/Cys-tRNA(Cys) deacylase
MLVLVAGDRELDLKRVASAVGEKKVRMASYKEAEALTGLQVGGISALALLNRPFDVFVDQPATDLTHVLVSAGKRGINLRLPVPDLIRITRARVIQATRPADEDA